MEIDDAGDRAVREAAYGYRRERHSERDAG
jgi:hypothetical protein